jgi:hypothetical protein
MDRAPGEVRSTMRVNRHCGPLGSAGALGDQKNHTE